MKGKVTYVNFPFISEVLPGQSKAKQSLAKNKPLCNDIVLLWTQVGVSAGQATL